MSQAAFERQHYTYGDLLKLEDDTRYELYDGQPVALASPSSAHQLISGELHRQIANFLVGKKCKVFPAPYDVFLFARKDDDLNDADTLVQPDISVVCDSDKIDKRGCKGAPDLVIEITSPSTRRNDRLVKFYKYQQAGVREYWIVDPDARAVLVHVLENGQYPTADVYAAGAPVPVSVLGGFTIDTSTLFS